MPSRSRIERPAMLALAAGISFAVVTLAYRSGALRQLDAEVAFRLHDLRSEQLYALAGLDDIVLRATPVFVAGALLALVLLLRGGPWSWIAPLGIGGSAVVDFGFKVGWSVFLHPRQLLSAAQILIGLHYHGLSPYPSGHVERATFVAVIAIAFLPRLVAVPLVALALFTPFARMYIEAHRLSEVLGGIDIGIFLAACAVLAVAIAPRLVGGLRAALPARSGPDLVKAPFLGARVRSDERRSP